VQIVTVVMVVVNRQLLRALVTEHGDKFGMGGDNFRRAGAANMLVKTQHFIGFGHHQMQVMGNHQHTAAQGMANLINKIIQRHLAGHIYALGRFIQHQQLRPDKKAQLDENLLFFTASLTKNDKIIATMLSPVSGKGYFVFHDAYGYFEKHYGLTPLGYFTINPEIQPGAQALHNIRTQLVEHKSTVHFC